MAVFAASSIILITAALFSCSSGEVTVCQDAFGGTMTCDGNTQACIAEFEFGSNHVLGCGGGLFCKGVPGKCFKTTSPSTKGPIQCCGCGTNSCNKIGLGPWDYDSSLPTPPPAPTPPATSPAPGNNSGPPQNSSSAADSIAHPSSFSSVFQNLFWILLIFIWEMGLGIPRNQIK